MRWNSPPIKTGISRVRCGNQPSVGKQRVGPSVLPSPALSLILTCSLPPVSLTLTVTPPLSHPHFCLSSSLFQTCLLERRSIKSIFLHSLLSSLELCTVTHLIFSPFSLLCHFFFHSHTQISIAFSPNSPRLSEVHSSSVLASPNPPPSLLSL